jgi:hypothetical protein
VSASEPVDATLQKERIHNMTRTRIVGLVLVAMFALGAVGAASAATESWFVAGSSTFGKETLSEKTKVKPAFTLGFKKGAVEISCKKLTDVAGVINQGNTAAAKSLKFASCKVIKPSKKCKVESVPGGVSGVIETGEVEATLLSGPAVRFAPKGGGNFTEFKLTGEACGVAVGKFNVKGQATGTSTKPEEKTKTLTFSATSGSELKVGEEPAQFAGAAGLTLSSGKAWGTQ